MKIASAALIGFIGMCLSALPIWFGHPTRFNWIAFYSCSAIFVADVILLILTVRGERAQRKIDGFKKAYREEYGKDWES